MMQELVEYIVKSLIDNDDFDVTVNESARAIRINVDSKDIGKVIGRGGKIAKAIRSIVKAAASKQGRRYNVEIVEREETTDCNC